MPINIQNYTNIFRNPPIDYTSRDFEAIREDSLFLIPFFNPEWTDRNPSDPGITIIEVMAVIADTLHFYMDRVAREAFLPTAVHRRSVANILALIDYQLQSASPSTVDLNFSLDSALGTDVVVPAGTQVSTSGDTPTVFETRSDATIPAGELEVRSVSAIQGLTASEVLSDSSGEPFQERKVTGTPIIDGSLYAFVDEGSGDIEWTVVDSLFDSEPNDRHVTYDKDANDLYTILFGDNANGRIPADSAGISVQYRLGGGKDTNVPSGMIDTVLSTVYDGTGTPVSVIVTNPLAATGGEDRQSIQDAKIQGPRSLRTLYRAVTQDDIETWASQVLGVDKAHAVNAGFNIVRVYIVPSGGGAPSSTLLTLVDQELSNRGMLTVLHQSLAAEYVSIELTATAHVLDNYRQLDVQERVEDALEDYFSLANQEFSQDVRLGDIYALFENIRGVDYVVIERLTLTPTPDYEVWSGNATIGVVTISQTTVAATWSIVLTSPTTFEITETTDIGSTTQINTGTFGVQYVSDNDEVSFTITVGATPNQVSDRLSFRVSELVGTVRVLAGELAIEQAGGFSLDYEGGT